MRLIDVATKNKGGLVLKKEIEKEIEAQFVKNYDKYYRVAYSYMGNAQDAMDVVQESAYKAILKSNSIKDSRYVDTWIYRTVINTSIDMKRKQKNILHVDQIETPWQDKHEDLYVKLLFDEMEEPDRSILTLRFLEELSLKQISEILKMKEGTVKSRLYRGLDRLKLKFS